MVPISPQAFSAEAVVFDSRKALDYIDKLQEKRDKEALALEEALSKYHQDKVNRTTPTGMATNDLPAFNKMLDDVQLYYAKNKSSISRDPMKRYEYDRMWNNILNFTVESKNKGEEAKPGEDLMYNPAHKYDINHDELGKDIDAAKAPIYIQDEKGNYVRNPNRAAFKYNENVYLPKNIDYAKTFEDFAKGFEKTTLEDVGRKGLNKIVIKGYDKPAVSGIIDNAYNTISGDREKMSSLKVEAAKIPPSELLDMWRKHTVNFHPEIAPEDPRNVLIYRLAEQAEKKKHKDEEFDREAYAKYQSSLIEGRTKQRLSQLLSQGNVIDNFPDTPLSRGTQPIGSIKSGVVYDNKGNLYTGEFRTAYEQLPADLPAVLGFVKIKLNRKPFTVEVKNGVIQSIKQDGGLRIGRQIIENAQRKLGKGMEFGPQREQGFIDDPLGILQ